MPREKKRKAKLRLYLQPFRIRWRVKTWRGCGDLLYLDIKAGRLVLFLLWSQSKRRQCETVSCRRFCVGFLTIFVSFSNFLPSGESGLVLVFAPRLRLPSKCDLTKKEYLLEFISGKTLLWRKFQANSEESATRSNFRGTTWSTIIAPRLRLCTMCDAVFFKIFLLYPHTTRHSVLSSCE